MNGAVRIVFLVIGLVLAGSAQAHEYTLGGLTVSHPWARASAGRAKAGAAYLSLRNDGPAADRLLAVTTPAARKAAIHVHAMDGGIMRMRPAGAIEISPGAPVVLEPSGLHVMLMGLVARLEEGRTFRLTLTFEKAGTIEVDIVIEAVGAHHQEVTGKKH